LIVCIHAIIVTDNGRRRQSVITNWPGELNGSVNIYKYPNTWSDPLSFPDAINSLAAIKKLIFDDRKYTMEDMVKALRANWEGYDEMR